MADYTNLTTLEGLAVGDRVIITTNNLAINLAGCKVKFEVNGSNRIGGYSCGTTVNGVNSTVYFNTTYSACFSTLPNTDSNFLYGRIIVAGNAGSEGVIETSYGSSSNPSYTLMGYGGGLEGGTSSTSNSNYATVARGGTQTSGGKRGSSTVRMGSFGVGGASTTETEYGTFTRKYTGGVGGAGWYGGAGGAAAYSSYGRGVSGGGGGSGYVLTSTSSKPDGYISDWETYVMTDETLITGGAEAGLTSMGVSSYNTGVITIIELGGSTDTTSKLNYFNGTDFVETNIYYYDGTEFKQCDVYYYNGTEFVKGGS